jgi:uncharacterized protein with FMN-binding domain
VGGTAAVLIIIGIATAPGAPTTTATPGSVIATVSGNAMDDVKLTNCASGPAASDGLTQVAAEITNHTGQVQSYLVTGSVNDPAGNRLTEVNGASNSVAPGQSATVDLIGGTTTGTGTAAYCTIANVTRIPS